MKSNKSYNLSTWFEREEAPEEEIGTDADEEEEDGTETTELTEEPDPAEIPEKAGMADQQPAEERWYRQIEGIDGEAAITLFAFTTVMESNLAWDISDTFNGLMMIPNLIGVIFQIPLIIRLTRNYIDRRLKGKVIAPLLSYDPDIQRDAAKAVAKGMG